MGIWLDLLGTTRPLFKVQALTASGTVTAPAFAGNASSATAFGVTNDTTTATAVYPTWVTANSGNLPARTTSSKLSFVPSTGVLTATGLVSGAVALSGLITSTATEALRVNADYAYLSVFNTAGTTRQGYIQFNLPGGSGLMIAGENGNPVSIWTAATERMRIDASGNVGIGVVPRAWNSSYKAIELNANSGGALLGGPNDVYLGVNSYYTNTPNWVRTAAGVTSLYAQNAGNHVWYSDASGAAGGGFTPTPRMTLDASGNLSATGRVTSTKLVASYTGADLGNGVTGDVVAARSASTGTYYFGSSNTAYLYFDGTTYIFGPTGGNVNIPGSLGIGTTPSFKLHVQAGNVNAAICALSGAANQYTSVAVGRTTDEVHLGIAGVANNWLNPTIQGDAALSQNSAAGNLWVGTGAGSGILGFVTNNAERIRIDSAGNVGIGTTPTIPFQLSRPGVLSSGTTWYQIANFTESASGNAKGVGLGYDSASQTGIVWGSSTSPGSNLAFWTFNGVGSWAERMRIDASGNVGIGRTPSVKLDVQGPDNTLSTEVIRAISANLTQSTSLTFAGLKSNAGAGLGFYVNNSTTASVSIDASGNVILAGSSSFTVPATLLLGNTAGMLSICANPSYADGTARIELFGSASSGGAAGMTLFGSTILFSGTAAGTERMRIDPYGNVITILRTVLPPGGLGASYSIVWTATSNTNLRASVKGSDGTTRAVNFTLA